MLTVLSGEVDLVDAGNRCRIARFFAYRRYPTTRHTSKPNMSQLSGMTPLIPLEFIRIKAASTRAHITGHPYNLEGWGLGLLVCDRNNPDDQRVGRGRQIVDSRDMPGKIGGQAALEPNEGGIVWEDCDTNEHDHDPRNIAQVIARCFQGSSQRHSPTILASIIHADMVQTSDYS